MYIWPVLFTLYSLYRKSLIKGTKYSFFSISFWFFFSILNAYFSKHFVLDFVYTRIRCSSMNECIPTDVQGVFSFVLSALAHINRKKKTNVSYFIVYVYVTSICLKPIRVLCFIFFSFLTIQPKNINKIFFLSSRLH